MKTSTVSLIRLEPSEGMHLKNKGTGEVYDGFIYIAKSLSENDFDEITDNEYWEIITQRGKENDGS